MMIRETPARWLLVTLFLCLSTAGGAPQPAATPAQSPSGDLQKGIALFQQGKYSEAHQELLAATERNPSSAEGFFYLAMADLRLHHPAAAEKNLRHALTLDPRSGSVLYNLGVLLLEEEQGSSSLSGKGGRNRSPNS